VRLAGILAIYFERFLPWISALQDWGVVPFYDQRRCNILVYYKDYDTEYDILVSYGIYCHYGNFSDDISYE
jgi:hypothetical protein